VHLRTFAQTVDDALITFLRSGRLPWSFRLPPGTTLEQLVLQAWPDLPGQAPPGDDGQGRRGLPPAIRQRLVSVLGLPEARDRLLNQFSASFIMAVLRSLSPEAAVRVARIETTLAGALEAARGQAGPSSLPGPAFARSDPCGRR
jgi:hypothetical protein